MRLTSKQKTISYLYYKPRGLVCSKGTSEGKTVFDAVKEFKNLNTVGRLDKESEGLLILTNDGILAKAVTSPKHLIEKEYEVEVHERITGTKINALSKSMMLTDGPTLESRAELIDDHTFRIVIREGRNHQIRRMADKVGLSVLRLQRIRIGPIIDKTLKEGDWRPLTKTEVNKLKSY